MALDRVGVTITLASLIIIILALISLDLYNKTQQVNNLEFIGILIIGIGAILAFIYGVVVLIRSSSLSTNPSPFGNYATNTGFFSSGPAPLPPPPRVNRRDIQIGGTPQSYPGTPQSGMNPNISLSEIGYNY